LVQLQAGSIKRAIGTSDIKRLYIDGGFSDNQVFLELLSNALNKMKIRTTNASLGSAMGAAIVISDRRLNPEFLKENYALQKHIPLILR
jgi:sugar (pentulose or hexulose) kinase